MTDLKKEELQKVEGGAIKLALGKCIFIGGIVTFIIGTINGYLRPLACNSEK